MTAQKGFTLIELLIVIAVIAILAAAILAAINPVEQLRKADDARRRSDTAELMNALDRYKSMFRFYPWGTSTVESRCPDLPGGPGTCDHPNGTIDIYSLLSHQEIKPEFANRQLNEYFMTEDSNLQARVCFLPRSTTWSDYSVAKYDDQGQPCPACNPRYVCVPDN